MNPDTEAPGTATVRESDDPEPRVRVQGIRRVRPTGSIAWSEYLKAVGETVQIPKPKQDGCDYDALVGLLGHEPITWRPARFLSGETTEL
jgi:hypothetical protein